LEGFEGGVVGIGESVQVLLGGGDPGVAEPVHNGLEVGSAREEPGGMRMSQVMHPHAHGEAGCLDSGPPRPGPEGVA